MAILNSCNLIAFVGTSDMNRAKAFYGDRLGLTVVSEDGFALVLDAHGTMVRVTLVSDVRVAPYTVLGWGVVEIAACVTELKEAGVMMERFAGIEQDELGIWTAPGGGARVAWFKDPDGNLLSVSQH